MVDFAAPHGRCERPRDPHRHGARFPRERFVPGKGAELAYVDRKRPDLGRERRGARPLPDAAGGPLASSSNSPRSEKPTRSSMSARAPGYSAAVLARIAGSVIRARVYDDLARTASDCLRSSEPARCGWCGGCGSRLATLPMRRMMRSCSKERSSWCRRRFSTARRGRGLVAVIIGSGGSALGNLVQKDRWRHRPVAPGLQQRCQRPLPGFEAAEILRFLSRNHSNAGCCIEAASGGFRCCDHFLPFEPPSIVVRLALLSGLVAVGVGCCGVAEASRGPSCWNDVGYGPRLSPLRHRSQWPSRRPPISLNDALGSAYEDNPDLNAARAQAAWHRRERATGALRLSADRFRHRRRGDQ